MRNVLLLLAVCVISVSATAQSDTTPSAPGEMRIHTSHVIDSLEKATRGKDELQGYRIQIYLGSATEAKAIRTKFLNLGTGLPCNMVQNIPNYAVRVGDFRTSLEAHKHLSQVKAHYPSAFVVQDKINPPKLPKRQP